MFGEEKRYFGGKEGKALGGEFWYFIDFVDGFLVFLGFNGE